MSVIPALRQLAEDYAATLRPGSTIDEAADGPYIAPFRHLLPGLLAKRGLMVEQAPGGFVVKVAPWASALQRTLKEAAAAVAAVAAPRPPVTCGTCGQSWFACEHGALKAVLVRWPDYEAFAPMLPSMSDRRPRA